MPSSQEVAQFEEELRSAAEVVERCPHDGELHLVQKVVEIDTRSMRIEGGHVVAEAIEDEVVVDVEWTMFECCLCGERLFPDNVREQFGLAEDWEIR